jgi:excisionase family DNA binding protein
MPKVITKPAQPYLTVTDVAALCNVHFETIYREIRRGHLKAVRVGNNLRIRPEDLRAYQNRTESTGPLSDEQIAEIKAVVASWPKLSPAQRDAIGALFADAGEP